MDSGERSYLSVTLEMDSGERSYLSVTLEMDSGKRSYPSVTLEMDSGERSNTRDCYLMVVQRVEGFVRTLVHRVLRDVRHKTEPSTLVSTFSGHQSHLLNLWKTAATTVSMLLEQKQLIKASTSFRLPSDHHFVLPCNWFRSTFPPPLTAYLSKLHKVISYGLLGHGRRNTTDKYLLGPILQCLCVRV